MLVKAQQINRYITFLVYAWPHTHNISQYNIDYYIENNIMAPHTT